MQMFETGPLLGCSLITFTSANFLGKYVTGSGLRGLKIHVPLQVCSLLMPVVPGTSCQLLVPIAMPFLCRQDYNSGEVEAKVTLSSPACLSHVLILATEKSPVEPDKEK